MRDSDSRKGTSAVREPGESERVGVAQPGTELKIEQFPVVRRSVKKTRNGRRSGRRAPLGRWNPRP